MPLENNKQSRREELEKNDDDELENEHGISSKSVDEAAERRNVSKSELHKALAEVDDNSSSFDFGLMCEVDPIAVDHAAHPLVIKEDIDDQTVLVEFWDIESPASCWSGDCPHLSDAIEYAHFIDSDKNEDAKYVYKVTEDKDRMEGLLDHDDLIAGDDR